MNSGLSEVQDMNVQDFLALSFFVSCINIFDNSLYKMYVLIQFVLLCQMLSVLRTGYVYDRMIVAAKKICLKERQEGRKWLKNEEAEIEKRRRK